MRLFVEIGLSKYYKNYTIKRTLLKHFIGEVIKNIQLIKNEEIEINI